MSESNGSPNKRRPRNDDDAESGATNMDPARARKRRAFLQTMGQQLREFGNDNTGRQENTRTTFGTSPGIHARPASGSTEIGSSVVSSHNVDTPESDAALGEDDQLPAGVTKSAFK